MVRRISCTASHSMLPPISPAAQRPPSGPPRRSTGEHAAQKIACQRHQALKKAKTGAGCHRLPARELRKAHAVCHRNRKGVHRKAQRPAKTTSRWSWSPPPGKAGRSARRAQIKTAGSPKAARGSCHIKQSQAHGASMLTLHTGLRRRGLLPHRSICISVAGASAVSQQ